MSTSDLTNLNLALTIARAGMPVFPCLEADGLAQGKNGKAKGAKAPYTGSGFKAGTTDEARIQEWWAQWPNAVPGIPTGEASGISVVDGDIDKVTGETTGEAQISYLGLNHPDAVTVRTQSGGVQIIYRHTEGARTTSKQVGSNIDTRGDGGYIIAPGARMQNGATYRYEGRSLLVAMAAGDLPEYPVKTIEAAIARAREPKRSIHIDPGSSIFGQTEANDAETLDVLRRLLAEAPNHLCREDWVKLAVSLHVAYGETLRDAFIKFSLNYSGGEPCTPEAAAHVWQSSGAPHTITGIGPALSLLKGAIGQEQFTKIYAETFERTRNHAPGQVGQKPKPKFELIRSDLLTFSEPEFLIDGLMETETLSLFFGDPGSGKSFAALDVACCLATGKAFHGRTVKAGAVIYICGEGKNGIKRRLTAWERHHGVSLKGKPLYVSRVAAQFLSRESIEAVVEAIDAAAAEAGEVALIIIDTLNRNMGAGDESSTKDMTAFVSAVDMVKDKYGATALVVHHTGHGNKERARGSMSLLGALDAEYRVEKTADGTVTLTNTKMKDAGTPRPMAFDLVEIEVGRNRKGEAITSAILSETEAPTATRRGLPPKVKQTLETFYETKKRAGHRDDPSQGVHVDDWRTVFYERSTADALEAKKKAFQRYRDDLVTREILGVTDDVYRLLTVPPGFTV